LNKLLKYKLRQFKHIPFLRDVLIFSLTAFGGPQGHFGMLIKTFVEKRKYLTINELINFNVFCQLLPGATSTQTLMLIGYKRGGIWMALLTLMVWILPATLFMGLLAFFVNALQPNSQWLNLFKYVQPMAIGFLAFSTFEAIFNTIKSRLSFFIAFISFCLSILFFKGPWIFPVLLFIGAIISRFFSTDKTKDSVYYKMPMKWIYIRLFFLLFFCSAFMSEFSRKMEWTSRKEFNLIEHFYRFGSIVFGGGDVLVPMMYEQFVVRPTSEHILKNNSNVLKIESKDFLTGSGLIRAIPGPVFSIASFMGIMVYKDDNFWMQVLGGITSVVALFAPGILLVLFFYPIFNNLQRYKAVVQSISGIQAAVVGMLLTSFLYLLKETFFIPISSQRAGYISFSIIFTTFLLLKFTKISPQYIVVLFLVLGFMI